MMNFVADLDRLTIARLKELGYQPKPNDTPHGRFATLYTYAERIIPPIPYTIRYSAEIRKNPKFQAHRRALEEIAACLAKGKSLRPYLSTRAVRPAFHDSLLLTWGIHHLHLNTANTANKKGFVSRPRGNSELLMLRIHEQTAYLIDIAPHSDKDLFDSPRLLEIVDTNWPELHIEAKSITGSVFTPQEIRALRSKNCNFVMAVNGRTIMPRLGVMSSGAPIETIRMYDALQEEVLNVEANVRQRFYEFFPRRSSPSTAWRAIHDVRLVGIEDEFFLIEEYSTKQRCMARRVTAPTIRSTVPDSQETSSVDKP
jgi:hypothetical protein